MVEQPVKIEEIADLYANLMGEIKLRLEVVQRVATGQLAMPQTPAFEFCYLQLRKVCEVFALACICAHGDIPEVRSKLLQKAYNADQIIKQLGHLHPDFYPVPGRQEIDQSTGRPVKVVPVTSGFLTKEDLLTLYGECGDHLHRGSIRQLITNSEPKPDFDKIREWVSKIMKFLNHHQIQTTRPDRQLWVMMQSKDDGKVKCSVMMRVPQPDT
jgi:hypothetical protein